MKARAVANVLIAAVMIVSFACTSGDRAGAGPAVELRDSAGIEIVDVGHPEWGDGEGWTAGPEPVLSIGALEGDDAYQLLAEIPRQAEGKAVKVRHQETHVRWHGQGETSAGAPAVWQDPEPWLSAHHRAPGLFLVVLAACA